MKTMTNQSGVTDLPPERSARVVEEFEQPRYSRRDTLLTMFGVLMVMLLGSLDQTIVATALPHVIADLHGFDRYTWVSTAYLLASTVTVPIYGKLSDLFGRKPIFLFGIVLFLVGSALSGASQSMNQLIAFRAFQGLGTGALTPIAIAVVGDLFTPRERGKWQGVTGAVFGLSAIIGPTLGGWITQYSSWRWVFYVNLPVGILALLVLIFLMPMLRGKAQKVSIDYIGAAMLVAGTVALLLGLTLAGSQYAWLSPQIIGLLAGSLVMGTVFVLYEAWLERHDGQPIIAPSLFKHSIFAVSTLITFIFGMGLFGAIFFIPLYVQNAIPNKIGQATAALTFFRSIGGTIALAVMGSVLNAAYLPAFNNALPPAIKHLATVQPKVAQFLGIFHNPQVLLQPDVEAQLLTQATHQGSASVTMFNQVIESVKVGLSAGIHDVFLITLVIMVVGTIAVFFLKEIPLRGGRKKAAETPTEESPEAKSKPAAII